MTLIPKQINLQKKKYKKKQLILEERLKEAGCIITYDTITGFLERGKQNSKIKQILPDKIKQIKQGIITQAQTDANMYEKFQRRLKQANDIENDTQREKRINSLEKRRSITERINKEYGLNLPLSVQFNNQVSEFIIQTQYNEEREILIKNMEDEADAIINDKQGYIVLGREQFLKRGLSHWLQCMDVEDLSTIFDSGEINLVKDNDIPGAHEIKSGRRRPYILSRHYVNIRFQNTDLKETLEQKREEKYKTELLKLEAKARKDLEAQLELGIVNIPDSLYELKNFRQERHHYSKTDREDLYRHLYHWLIGEQPYLPTTKESEHLNSNPFLYDELLEYYRMQNQDVAKYTTIEKCDGTELTLQFRNRHLDEIFGGYQTYTCSCKVSKCEPIPFKDNFL